MRPKSLMTAVNGAAIEQKSEATKVRKSNFRRCISSMIDTVRTNVAPPM